MRRFAPSAPVYSMPTLSAPVFFTSALRTAELAGGAAVAPLSASELGSTRRNMAKVGEVRRELHNSPASESAPRSSAAAHAMGDYKVAIARTSRSPSPTALFAVRFRCSATTRCTSSSRAAAPSCTALHLPQDRVVASAQPGAAAPPRGLAHPPDRRRQFDERAAAPLARTLTPTTSAVAKRGVGLTARRSWRTCSTSSPTSTSRRASSSPSSSTARTAHHRRPRVRRGRRRRRRCAGCRARRRSRRRGAGGARLSGLVEKQANSIFREN